MAVTLANLERLKLLAVEGAREALERERPDYVAAFRERLVELQDWRAAEREARPHLRGSKAWPRTLTAVFDLQLGLERLSESMQLLEEATPDNPPVSDLWHYHFEFWVLRSDSALERCEKVANGLIDAWRFDAELQRRRLREIIRKDLQAAKKPIARHRQGYAHGMGGGVEGITKHWPSFLAMPDAMIALAGFKGATTETLPRSTTGEHRRRWLVNVRLTHGQTMHNIDDICGVVANGLPPLRSRGQ